jgi:3-phenylpropionate/trans-cinnamate dioxygenase ferredoxin reductase subunit
MLGQHVECALVPFFWSQHYDTSISYVGHAESWDNAEVSGSSDTRDLRVEYRKDGRRLAVATVGRDLESLEAEATFEQSWLSGR